MNITIIAVGKLKEKFWKDAIAEYSKRLGAYCKLKIIEIADRDPAKCGGELKAMEMEAADILKALPASCHTILLAIDGRQRSSEEFSAHLDELALHSQPNTAFIIGGSTGVAPAVRACASELLSFGKITLPHNLARVVLLEQIYRAFKISHGEPYHK